MFKPKKIIGVDNACYDIKACRETFIAEQQKSLIRERKKLTRILEKKDSMSHAEFKKHEKSIRGRTQSLSSGSFDTQIEVSPEQPEPENLDDDLISERSAESLLHQIDEL